MLLKRVEEKRNRRAWRDSRLTVSGLNGHPSTPNPKSKKRDGTPEVSLDLQEPFLRLTGHQPRQSGGTFIGQVSTDCTKGEGVRPILTTPGSARSKGSQGQGKIEKVLLKCHLWCSDNCVSSRTEMKPVAFHEGVYDII